MPRSTGPQPRPRVAEEGEAGWAAVVMVWLRYVTQFVAVNLLLIVGTLAGFVVLGLFPALASGSALLARLAKGEPTEHLWRDFWSGWRAGLLRMNLLGLPLLLAYAVLLIDIQVVAGDGAPRGAFVPVLGVLAYYLSTLSMFLFPVARRYDETYWRTWRFLLAAPLLAPLTTIGVALVVVVSVVVGTAFTVYLPLAAIAVLLFCTGWLVDRALDRIDARTTKDDSESG